MALNPFRITALDTALDRAHFKCGSVPLDRYFQQQVTQEIRRRVASCFVALTAEQRIAGFYTLSSASVLLTALPPAVGKKLPRYPSVPAIRMGRLAVDLTFKGQGLGGALLADALLRALNTDIAAHSLIVDAKDKRAAAFYQHHGFVLLPDSPLTLFLPLASCKTLVGK